MSEADKSGEVLEPPWERFERICRDLSTEDAAFFRAREKHILDQSNEVKAYALRIEPVCRNCIHAGPLTYNGNYPYDNSWGSCQKNAPIPAPVQDRIEQYTNANAARWAAVRHSQTCGEFKLRPVRDDQKPEALNYVRDTKWAWETEKP